MTIRLVMADDDIRFRALIRDWLGSERGVQLVGEAANGCEALAIILDLKPQAVLMDISMPVLNGIEATRQIMMQRPETLIIGTTIHSDKRFQDEMFAAGARAHILKENLVRDLFTVLGSLTDRPTRKR